MSSEADANGKELEQPKGLPQPPANPTPPVLNLPAAFNPNAYDYSHWWPGITPHFLIYACPEFMVWLDKEFDLDWKTSPALDKQIEGLKEQIGSILNAAARLQAIPIDHLTDSQKVAGRRLIGEGVARAFKQDLVNANQMLEEARRYIQARNEERARFWYLSAAAVTAGIALAFLSCLWLCRKSLSEPLGPRTLLVLVGAGVGAVGALFSILLRLGKASLDPAAGPDLHYFEGAGRVVAGAISAAACAVAIKSGQLLPILNSTPLDSALFLTCFLFGGSERLLPAFITHASPPQAGLGPASKE